MQYLGGVGIRKVRDCISAIQQRKSLHRQTSARRDLFERFKDDVQAHIRLLGWNQLAGRGIAIESELRVEFGGIYGSN